MPNPNPNRCPWPTNDLAIVYHDTEWGVPVRDDPTLFEFLILEGAQAGLSWDTILKKRDSYRQAFDHFDPAKIARYTPARIEKLLKNEGIVRNRLKVEGTVKNARAYPALAESLGGKHPLAKHLWSFVNNQPINARRTDMKQIPAKTPESDAMSKSLKKLGFSFVGSTICYALMQATGLVNDHLITCPRHKAVQK